MSCLIEFLSDTNQKSIINMIQNRDETYQKQLESYGKLFTNQLRYCLEKSGDNCNKNDCVCKIACCRIRSKLDSWFSNNYKPIEDFFTGINKCYTSWINSKIAEALNKIENLLKDDNYEIISEPVNTDVCLKDVENRVFFRARQSSEYLTRKEIFHIPFNKRYLIPNQRFSLTGLPILYLGNSIADLLEEIGGNPEESICNQRVSSFECININKDTTKIIKPDKIFDLRCNIRQSLSDSEKFTKVAFFRNILSHICSFRKRKEVEKANFKEEYVIPQMLSIILHEKGYDGICYYSTKPFYGYSIKDAGSGVAHCDENMKYRENVAIFTKMKVDYTEETLAKANKSESVYKSKTVYKLNTTSDSKTVYESKTVFESDTVNNSNKDNNSGNGNMPKPDAYDEKLFDSMEISIPIAIENVNLDSIDENEITKLYEAIYSRYESLKEEFIHDEEKKVKSNSILAKAKAISSYFDSVYKGLYYNYNPYSKTKAGKIHIQLLVGILNRLLVEISLN